MANEHPLLRHIIKDFLSVEIPEEKSIAFFVEHYQVGSHEVRAFLLDFEREYLIHSDNYTDLCYRSEAFLQGLVDE